MKVKFVVYTGGKWDLINGNIEYVTGVDSRRRGLEIETDHSYNSFLNYVSKMCDTPNITRLSYRMSTFTDPIDIINDRDVRFFFDQAMQNPFELYKLYVIQESDVGSSGLSCLNNLKAPDLNIPLKESFDILNDECPNLEKNYEKSLTSHNQSGSSSIVFDAGHIFNNKEEMKLELGKKSLLEHFEFKVDRSSKTRYEVSCLGDGCEWRFKAHAIPCGNLWFVKHMNDSHTCSKTQTHPHFRQANPKVLGHFLKEQLKDSGRIYRAKEIVKDFRQRFEVEITNLQAWRGKSYALELLQGTTRDSFAELPIYCYNLKLANPGSVTHILVDEQSRFEMVFVALGAAIRSFMLNLRPVVIIDAAHLKGEFKGTLFLAVGMDGNNQILPLAYGIGKSEDGESWTWFLSKLRDCVGEIADMAIISDRANSIHVGVRNVFPRVYHGLCCRHLMMNLRLPSSKKKEYEALWWKTCKSYRMSDFTESFNALCLAVPRIRQVLTNIGFGRWARAHCPGNRYHYMTSNSAESINSLSRFSRKMPITQLIEFFRESVQKWFYDRRLQGMQESHSLTQWAQKKILKKIEGSRTWTVAGIRQVSGLPCGHVIAVSRFLGEPDCSHYAFSCYSNEVYKKTYEESINPLPHRSEWVIPEGLGSVLPPNITKRQSGRPKENNRILSRGEEPVPVYCSRCRTYGHVRDVCLDPMKSQIRSRKSSAKGKEKETETQSSTDDIFPSYNLAEF
ncbi:uncharacterized protein LOC110934159 [Helianthus annuus]|uniref:uncharacterized protein LOC110934159 n=1 Tax=Helianthus annuus TaxID=4232 RepID=UPI000B90410F|nr:uncharacterized protein LOC110934159 [Helianthus annuus]